MFREQKRKGQDPVENALIFILVVVIILVVLAFLGPVPGNFINMMIDDIRTAK
jgi:hypothetical protein